MTIKTNLAAMALAATLTASAALAEAPASSPSAPPPPPPPPKEAPKAAADKAEHISVQHVLIGFQGSVPGKPITRTKEDAKKLADEILQRARKGEDFGALVKQYTDDSAPGIYGMSNDGVAPVSGETARGRMVKGFGDASFSLKVGEVGIAEYDPGTSPYGWHIVKRLK